MWGVTLERLVSRGHRSIRKVLSPDTAVQDRLVQKAHSVGLARLAKMVSSGTDFIAPKSPREMVQYLHAYFHGIPVKIAPRLKPNVQPVLADLRRATAFARDPLAHRAEIKWRLEFPAYLGSSSFLARACITSVAAVVDAPVQSRAKSTTRRLSALFARYLTALRIPSGSGRDLIYKSVLTGEIASKKELISLFNKLKLPPSPIPFLARILEGESPIDVVVSELSNRPQSFGESAVRLIEFLGVDNRAYEAESPLDKLAAMIASLEYADEGVIEVLQAFPGISAKQWLNGKEAILRKVPQAFTTIQPSGNLSSRLGVVAQAAEASRTIPQSELFELFPEGRIAELVRTIAAFSGDDAIFYLAASLSFYDPIEALKKFATALPRSPVPRDPLGDYRHFRDISALWQKSNNHPVPVVHIDTWFKVGIHFPTVGNSEKK